MPSGLRWLAPGPRGPTDNRSGLAHRRCPAAPPAAAARSLGSAAITGRAARILMGMAAAQALLLIDLQAAFVSGNRAVPGAEALLGSAKRLLSRAREPRSLVVHLQNDGEAGAPDEPGKPGCELCLRPLPG